ncbi:phage head closure protein [Priestia aryabhattai]|uniref:phage head closure protein n=1 Tax=Priestia aryabhattai TaxID=412384 RepID=UPI00234EBB52|nr:phage head closure protein [Priestia aryabhattai]MDC7762474.1 phage head closure protein [Priestia aryabhattai]
MFDEVIYLIKENDSQQNEEGFSGKKDTSRRDIFATEKSIRGNEFYIAAQSGYTLETMFEVHSLDYEGENVIEYKSKCYKVVRTYERKQEEITELICRAYGSELIS